MYKYMQRLNQINAGVNVEVNRISQQSPKAIVILTHTKFTQASIISVRGENYPNSA